VSKLKKTYLIYYQKMCFLAVVALSNWRIWDKRTWV